MWYRFILLFIAGIITGVYTSSDGAGGAGGAQKILKHRDGRGAQVEGHASLQSKVPNNKEVESALQSAHQLETRISLSDEDVVESPEYYSGLLSTLNYQLILKEMMTVGGVTRHQNNQDIQSLVNLWSSRDPEASFNWLLNYFTEQGELSSGQLKLVSGALHYFLIKDNRGAAERISELPAGKLRSSLVTDYLLHAGLEDTDQALAFFSSLEDYEERRDGAFTLAMTISYLHPYRTMSFVDENADLFDEMSLKTIELQSLRAIGRQISTGDNVNDIILGLLEYSDFPDDLRNAVLNGVMDNLLREPGLESTLNLIEILPSGDLRDSSINTWITRLGKQGDFDLEQLFELTSTITNPVVRNDAALKLLAILELNDARDPDSEGGDVLLQDELAQQIIDLISPEFLEEDSAS